MAVALPVPALVALDTGSVLTVTCKNLAGTVIDLTGSTVTFRYTVDNGLLVALTARTMVVSAPTTGVATYQFVAADLPTQTATGQKTSKLAGEVRIVDSGAKELTSLSTINAVVRNRLT